MDVKFGVSVSASVTASVTAIVTVIVTVIFTVSVSISVSIGVEGVRVSAQIRTLPARRRCCDRRSSQYAKWQTGSFVQKLIRVPQRRGARVTSPAS